MARGEVTGRKPKTDRDIPHLRFRIPGSAGPTESLKISTIGFSATGSAQKP